MKRESSIKKNYIYKLAYQIVTFVFPVLTTPYISRVFGVNGVGIYSYTSSVASYCILFSALGTATYGAREISRERDNIKELAIVFWEVEIIRIISTFVCLVIWLVFSWYANVFSGYYFAFVLQIFAAAFDITWLYEGIEQFKLIVIRNVVIKILGIVYLFLFIKDANDLIWYIVSVGLISFLGNVSLWKGCEELFIYLNMQELHLCKHMKNIIVYFVPTLATSVYTVLDKTMIGYISNQNENGYYEQSERIISIGKSLAATLPSVIAPRNSYLFAKNQYKEIKKIVFFSIEFTLFITIPIAMGIVAIANKLVPWYLGKEFEKSIILLYVLAPMIIIVGLSGSIGLTYLTPSGQRAKSSMAIILGAIINFILNLYLIPRFQSIGAAIASVVAELVITGIYIYMSKQIIVFLDIIKMSYKKMLSSGIMFVIISCPVFQEMRANWKTSLLQIICAVIVYIFFEMLFKDNCFNYIRSYLYKIQNDRNLK